MRLYFSELKLLQTLSEELRIGILLEIGSSRVSNKASDNIEFLCNGSSLQMTLYKGGVYLDYTKYNNSYSSLNYNTNTFVSLDKLLWATEIHLHDVIIWFNNKKYSSRNVFFHSLLDKYMEDKETNNILIAIESQRKLSFLYVLEGIIFKSYRVIGVDKFTDIKEKFYMTSFSALFKKSNAHIVGVSSLDQVKSLEEFKEKLESCTDNKTYRIKFKGGV